MLSKKSIRECLARSADTVLHEFAASMLMLALFVVLLAYFFPFGDVALWPMHAAFVFVFDYLTPGACANPAFTAGLYVFGKVDAWTAIAKFLGQYWAGKIAFAIMGVLPFASDMLSRSAAVSPSTSLPLLEACLVEAALTALLAGAAFFISNRFSSAFACSVVVAVVLRLVIQVGGPLTGACINPLAALCWLAHHLDGDMQAQHWEFVLVYVVSPMAGASVAAAAVTVVNEVFPAGAGAAGSMLPAAVSKAPTRAGKASEESSAGEEVPAKPGKMRAAKVAKKEQVEEQEEKPAVRRRRRQSLTGKEVR